MPAIPWWAWAVLAAAIGLAELHAPGGYLVWIGLGAAATAAISAAAGPLSVTAQIGIFAVASAVSCLGGYFVYRRRSARRTDDAALNRRGQLLLGTHGVACAAFVNGQGKVRLGDTVWLAEGAELAEGSPVVVTEVRGARVIVAEAGAVKS